MLYNGFSKEADSWVLAAEKFTSVDVPPIYENHTNVLPQMLLAHLSRISSRTVLPAEAQSRKLQKLEDTRIEYILKRNDLVVSRDKLLLNDDSNAERQKKRRSINLKIDEFENALEQIEETIVLQKTEDQILDKAITKLVLWKDGKELYTRKPQKFFSTISFF